MTTIHAQLSCVELEARYEAAADPVAKSHFHALWLVSCGYEIEEVAELLSFSSRWVRALIRRYNEGGAETLGDQRVHNGTKPTILTPAALAALKERIKTPPADGGLWTGPKIARWLARFHGLKSVHDQRGWDALIAIGYSIQQPRPRHPAAATEADRAALKKKLQAATAAERRRRPGATVEIWAMDEHRIGLKPITRGVWAPIGERPIALGHHRFEWLYVTGFVEPATGKTVWNVGNAICKEMFELILADFAKSVGAGPRKRIVLQLDNAGWHGPQNLAMPDGIRPVFQPAHSPELQPAEHLWAFVDEPLANHCFPTIASLDHAVADRCVALTQQQDTIRASTLFHWWPRYHARK
jgi:transposase